jgi:hypothetical protein
VPKPVTSSNSLLLHSKKDDREINNIRGFGIEILEVFLLSD